MTKRDRLQESLSLCCAFEEEKNKRITKEKEKMYVLWCRLFQRVMKFFMDIVPFWRKPKMITGRDSLKKLPGMLRHKGIKNVMLVTDPGIASLGLHEQLLEWIREEGIECVVYDRTTANPTIANVEEALQLYRENGCHALIAFGGGSPMDCAKGVGARVARPHKKISSMRGELKILKPIPPAHRRAYYGGDGKRDHPGGCADRREDA